MRIATDIVIAAPAERVWALLTDFTGYTVWNPYIVQIDGAAKAGTMLTVHAVMQPGAPPMVQPVELVAILPMKMHWRGGLPDRTRFVGDHYFGLTKVGGGTRFDHYEDFGGMLAESILAEHGALIRSNFERFNEALKRAAE